MNKLFVLPVFLFFVFGVSVAQKPVLPLGGAMSAEDRAKLYVDRMRSDLELTDEQTATLTRVATDFYAQRKQAESITDSATRVVSLRNIHKTFQTSKDSILTIEQRNILQTKMQEKIKQMQERMKSVQKPTVPPVEIKQ